MTLLQRLKKAFPVEEDKRRQAFSLVGEADEARNRKDWPMAARRYAAALKLDPSLTGIWVQLGHALKESGSLWRAEEAYRRAVSLDPDDAENFLQLGHTLKLRGDAFGAAKAYGEAERLKPDDPHIRREAYHMRRRASERPPSVLDWRPALRPPEDDERESRPVVYVYPDYTETNFYQNGLYSAFAPDVDVEYGRIDHAVEAAARRPTVFHLHWPEPLFGGCKTAEDVSRTIALFWRLVAVLKANGGQLFWTVHNALPHDRKFADQMLGFHRRLAEEADLVHVHSPAAIDVLEATYGTRIAHPVVLPHGNYIDVYRNEIPSQDARSRLDLPQEAFIFCFVGQLRPYKGVEALVEAFKTVQAETDRAVHLLIAGKPVWPTPPGDWAAVADQVEGMTVIEGFIDDDDLQVFLNAGDAVVLPYKDILTSGSAVMAAGFERPVLLPRLPTLEEAIDRNLGPSFDPDDVDGLVGALRAALAADAEKISLWRSNARAFAQDADWSRVSAALKARAPEPETWGGLTVRGCALRRRAGVPVTPGALGVALLTHHSAEDARDAAAALPKTVGGRRTAVFVLDNSEDPRELAKLRGFLPDAELLTADDNLGYAAGNNILLQRMRDAGCDYGLIINPDIRIDAEALDALLAEAGKGHIVSPLILNDVGAASFTGGTATIGDRVSIDQVLPDGDAPYAVDTLQGSAVMLPLAALDRVGFMEEGYFLYFEETDWFLSMKGKASLRVVPAAAAYHHKTSHGDRVPTPYYVYYFLRNALIFNKKYCGAFEAAQAHYDGEFVAGWRARIKKTGLGYLPVFEALAQAAFEDGAKGLCCRIDIQARLDEILGLSGTPGGVEYIEPDAIGGMTMPSFGGRPRTVWMFVGDYPALSVAANHAGPKASFADGRPRADFRIPLPMKTLLGPNAPVTLRESETGARLALSADLVENVVGADQLRTGHFSALETLRRRKTAFRCEIETCVNGVVRGWIADDVAPERTVYFDLTVDGATLSGLAANQPRTGRDTRDNGFEARLPPELVRGKTEIKVGIRPSGSDQPLLTRKIASTWRWGGYDPNFSVEAFFRWALLNRATPEGAYRESHVLQQYFANVLDLEKRRAAATDHDLTASIVTPVYNRERTIEVAMRSVIAQTRPTWELILVDDGSRDGSVEVIKRMIADYPDRTIRLIEMGRNVGVSAARNQGLAAATGDVIAYLDSDNVWKPDYLAVMLAAFAREPDRRSAYAGSEIWVRNPDTGGVEMTGVFVNPYSRSMLEQRNFIDLNVFAHRRDLYDERGGFSEDMTRLVDWRLILRYTKGAPPLFIPALLAEYFIDPSAGQITATADYGSNHEKILEEADLSRDFTP